MDATEKTLHHCTACNATDDPVAIVEHCANATEATGVLHAVKELKKKPQPKQVVDAHERVTKRAEVRDALVAQLGMPIEDIADALRGL